MPKHNLLTLSRITSVALVDRGANRDDETNEGAHLLLAKHDDGPSDFFVEKADAVYGDEEYAKKAYSTEQRVAMAKEGKAIPVRNDKGEVVDGRYPIDNGGDLSNAIQAFGRGSPGDKPTIKAHIIKNAKRLGLSDQIPQDWSKADSMTPAQASSHMEAMHGKKATPDASNPKAVYGQHDAAHKAGTFASGKEHTHSGSGNSSTETAAVKVADTGKGELQKVGRKISAARLQRLQDALAAADAAHKTITEIVADGNPPAEPTAKGGGKEGIVPEEFKKESLSPEALAAFEKIEADKAAAEKRVADLEKAATEADDDPIKKLGFTPEQEAYVRKLDEKATVGSTKAEALEVEKLDREAAEDIAKRAPNVVIDFTKVGPALRRMDAVDKDSAEALRTALAAASEQLKTASLFSTYGKAGDGGATGSAVQKLQAAAEEIRKADPKLTKEAAFSMASEANPELVEQYRHETGIVSGADRM